MKKIILLIIVFVLGLIVGSTIHIKEYYSYKTVQVDRLTIVENVYDYKIEVFCDKPSSGFCYSGDHGNCDGEITFEPRSNNVGDSKSNDLILRGYGLCTIKHYYKFIGFKFRESLE